MKKYKIYQICAFVFMGVGFLGTLITGIIAAAIYGDYPSIGSIVIICVFLLIFFAAFIWYAPMMRALRYEDNEIIRDYERPETLEKTYKLFIAVGLHIIEYGSIMRQLSTKLTFNSEGIQAGKDLKFLWKNIEDIKISGNLILLKLPGAIDNPTTIALPLKYNIVLLINTFYGEILLEPQDAKNLLNSLKTDKQQKNIEKYTLSYRPLLILKLFAVAIALIGAGIGVMFLIMPYVGSTGAFSGVFGGVVAAPIITGLANKLKKSKITVTAKSITYSESGMNFWAITLPWETVKEVLIDNSLIIINGDIQIIHGYNKKLAAKLKEFAVKSGYNVPFNTKQLINYATNSGNN